MSKSMFIVDTPKSCESCEFGQEVIVDNEMLTACTFKLYTRSMIMVKGCPLKPMPNKLDWKIGYVKDNNTCEIFNKNYVEGWNACIDELLGGMNGEQNE